MVYSKQFEYNERRNELKCFRQKYTLCFRMAENEDCYIIQTAQAFNIFVHNFLQGVVTKVLKASV